MPISRYHIQSAYRLADPELHRAVDKDDSEALLEAVTMAGLVGLLRQLGDLAQFAAEMFHNLHEEVMATAERGHGLKSRVQQLEADIPALEKAFLPQTHHSSFFTNGGIDWYPNLRYEPNPVTRGDLPRFILDSYEECRSPPRLFLLDKFDVAGAGACLKRYTDPSFFKAVSASSITATEVHREKRARRVRQKKGAWLRNGETLKPSHSKLHQLFLEEHIENADSDPARLVKLRKRQLDGSAVDAKTGKSYMEKFSEMPSPDHTMVCETSIFPLPVKWMSDDTSKTGVKILNISSTSPVRSLENDKTRSSPNEQELKLNSGSEMDRETNGYLVKVHEQISAGVSDEMSSNHLKVPCETEMLDDEQEKRECSLYGYRSDDATSEVDNYMDALATIDSELETDNECRPKKSLLNVQKITGLNGKEQQLQGQFLDSQSFGDSSMSEEIVSSEQDQNDEHNEMQAWLHESQSTGTPSVSDDDCALRRDRNQENTQLQLQFTDSQSIGNSSSEIAHIPSNQLPQTVELQNTSGEFVTHDDAHDQREMISDSIPVSSGPCLIDPGHLLFPSDLRVTSLVPRPTGTQSEETPSVPVERHLRLEDDEDRKFLVESIAAESHAASPIKDDSFPVVSFDCSSSSNMDVCDSYVHSNSEFRVSNDLNMFREDDGANHSDIKVLQAESLTEYSSEMSAVGDTGSQGEDPIHLSMEGHLNSGTELLPDDRNLHSEDDIVKTQHSSEDLFPVVETTLESSFTEELCSDLAHGSPHDIPDLAEVEIVYPDQESNFKEVPRIMPGHEINGSTCSLDSVEDAHCEHPPSSDYMRHDNRVRVNDMFSVKGQSQDQAISGPPCVDTAEKDASIVNCRAPDCISSPSRNLSNSHEPLPCSSESQQIEMESDEVELTKFPVELNAEKGENQQEQFSEIVSSSMSLTKLEEALSHFADTHEEKMEVDEAGDRESSTELSAHKVVDQPEIASTDTQLNMNKPICCAHDSGICNNVQHSSLKEKIQYGSSYNDMKMLSECSKPDSLRSESMFVWQNNLQNSKDSLSPSSYSQLDAETHLELFLKSQVGQEDARFQLRNEETYTSAKFQPQLPQISNQLEQERISNDAPEFTAEVHPDKPSRGSLLRSPGQKINSSGLLSDHLPKATNFEETPPMPPLPPMQWIMSKVQNTSVVSQREEIDVSQASFQPIQSIKPDYKSEFGLSTSERAALPYQNPFFPAVALESNKHMRSSGLSSSVSEHPVEIPLQFSPVLNEANGQHNYLILESRQAQNPCLTLPVVLSGRLPHGNVIASEGESVLNSSPCLPIMSHEYAVSGADPIFQQEKSAQSSCQLNEDTSLEAKEDGPGESHLVLPAECAVSGDDSISPKEKPSQSPNQFIEETILKVKTLDQSSINLERKQEDLVVSPESPPSVEIVQPNHNMLSSAGELALSLDTSARTSEFGTEMPNGKPKNELPCPPEFDTEMPNGKPKNELSRPPVFDTEMPNGKPKNKLPRPPNPVIDVAAALDKSRLRKASDRVRPQIAPKVDERDSLLEQIRSKSFNLKPAVLTRPSIPGPKTNLKVAAILEKANSIRQALAGSDEDDDTDSWSE